MADFETMTNIQNLANGGGGLASIGGVIGGLAGSVVGAPAIGSAIGSAVGTVASAMMPSYSHVKGSVAGVNFVTMGMKPYQLMVVEPEESIAKKISDYYCYYGCKTMRQEPLGIPLYMYNGHAYVKGDLQYNGSIPIDKFIQIKNIFNSGVHILAE